MLFGCSIIIRSKKQENGAGVECVERRDRVIGSACRSWDGLRPPDHTIEKFVKNEENQLNFAQLCSQLATIGYTRKNCVAKN